MRSTRIALLFLFLLACGPKSSPATETTKLGYKLALATLQVAREEWLSWEWDRKNAILWNAKNVVEGERQLSVFQSRRLQIFRSYVFAFKALSAVEHSLKKDMPDEDRLKLAKEAEAAIRGLEYAVWQLKKDQL